MNLRYDSYVGILMPSELAKIRSTEFTSPLGQNLLATYLSDRLQNFAAVCVNGEITSEEEIKRTIERIGRNPLIGFTLLSGNFHLTFKLAQKFSERRLDVILGGPEITCYGAPSIMESRSFIKYGVIGSGERTLLQVVNGAELKSIPNLVFREGSKLEITPYNKTIAENIDWLGVRIDYNLLIDLEKHTGVTYLTGNDCFIAHNRCVFCGRLPMGNPSTEIESKTRVERVWRELEEAQRKGIKRFYNSADSVGVNKKHLTRFTAAKPKNFAIDFNHVFFNAHEITREIIPCLHTVKASVYLGIENIALKSSVEKAGLQFYKDDLRALKLLSEANIPTRVSFVLGLPGESNKTLQENLEGIVSLVREHSNITDLELNPVEILPGTKLFGRFMERDLAEQFRKIPPPYDPIKLSEAYALEFCEITRTRTIEWIKIIYENVRRIRQEITINTKGISPEEYEFIKG